MKQEEYSHQNGNSKDMVKLEDCLSWQELTSSIDKDRCSNRCLPVILQSLFGQRNDLSKCHDPMQHECCINWEAGEIFFYKTYVLSIGYTETKYIKLKTKFQIPTFLYTFEKGGKENFFPLLKMFSSPPFSKVYKKVIRFSFTPTKNISI
jgi:hypothetical protein